MNKRYGPDAGSGSRPGPRHDHLPGGPGPPPARRDRRTGRRGRRAGRWRAVTGPTRAPKARPRASLRQSIRLLVQNPLLIVPDRALDRLIPAAGNLSPRETAARGRPSAGGAGGGRASRRRAGKVNTMRGELDDALARMERREALQRRLAQEAATRTGSPVNEVTEAVQRVVAQHPTVAVTMWVADGPKISAVHVAWEDGVVTVRPAAEPALPTAGRPPQSWPMTVRTVQGWAAPETPPTAEAAARLAEMVRRDPSLLGPDPDRP